MNRMIYIAKNMVAENNQIVYNDGVTKLYLYTKGTIGGSKELKNLLTFMDNPAFDNAVDEELLKILDIINIIKKNPKERERYMGIMGVTDYEVRDRVAEQLEEQLAERLPIELAKASEKVREKALAEGHAEGRAQGLIEGLINGCKFMKTTRETAKETIMTQYSLTEEKAEEYLSLYW